MKFGEKVRAARRAVGMTQEELAEAAGLSKRTIINYETGTRYPRDRSIYQTLAQILEVESNYLVTEDEEFITESASLYGDKGEREARELLQRTSALFAGGKLNDEDKLAFMLEIQQLYLESKQIAKKYSPKNKKDSANPG